MRLWSLHPKYLDTKGLLAVWREGLLAKKVLENKTVGYKFHPQLIRFKSYTDPLSAINAYLFEILNESKRRKYNFDIKKIKPIDLSKIISVNLEQVQFEFHHLLKKVKKRSPEKYNEIKNEKKIEVNYIFNVIPGKIENWERK